MVDNLIFESVLDVWIVWFLSLMLLSGTMYRVLSRRRWRSVARLSRDERGASYVLPYVLTFPWLLLLVCVMIQATLILLVKFGTVYASYAAARALIVWDASDPESAAASAANARYHADRAAMLAMTPFASGYEQHLDRIYPGAFAKAISTGRIPRAGLDTIVLDTLLKLYRGTYQQLGSAHNESGGHSPVLRRPNSLLQDNYVRNKLIFAALATQVEYDDDVVAWNEDREVTVTYLMPMHIPGAGRFLASKSPGPWYAPSYLAREITTTVTLPSETPKTDTNQLTVPYFPSFLTRYFGL